jgi:hypothetical protein
VKEARFADLLPLLSSHDIRFIVVGGGAAIAHGLARLTYDVDVVYDRSIDNIEKLCAAFRDLHPYLRGAPPGLPFIFDTQTIQAGLNFTLTTDIGDIDLLGEVTGGGTYADLLPFSEDLIVFGSKCRFVTLERLIQLKRAAGRPKDLEVLAELQVLLEERRKSGD